MDKYSTIRISLDDLLSKMEVTKYKLAKDTGIKYQTIDNYVKNRVVRYDSAILLKICNALGCTIDQVIEIK